jgi:putative DNA methylase
LIRLSADGDLPPLIDPFAGGGSIPLEAHRLGLEAHATDLNPVAVLINKALIEIPPRFAGLPPVNPVDAKKVTKGGSWKGARGLAEDVRYYGKWIAQRAEEKLRHLYPQHNGETVIAWLWARTVKSPNPAVDAHVPLVRSFQLSRKNGNPVWIRPIVEGKRVRFEIGTAKPTPEGTVSRAGGYCLISGVPIPLEYIRAEGRAGRMGAVLMAIVTEGKGGRNYHAATAEQQTIAESAQPAWRPTGDIPESALGFRIQLYGIDEYSKLFSPRQLTALTTLSDLVVEVRKQIEADALARGMSADSTPLRAGGRGARAYAEAISVYLAFAVDKCADYNSTLCSWNVSGQKVGHTFVRQALPMVWDYVEANPLSEAGGSFSVAVKYVADSVAQLGMGSEGRAYQADARTINYDRHLVISTDPPYYDNVGYADLSDFFYVWLRPMLREVYPELFSTRLVPKESELIAAAHRHAGDREAAKDFFEGGMRQTFGAMRSLSHMDYPLTIFYAYKQRDVVSAEAADEAEDEAEEREEGAQLAESAGQNGDLVASSGWETMLSGLLAADFSVVGTYPLLTELATRMNAQNSNALASSVVLVCSPRPANAPDTSRRHFMNALRQELPRALATLQALEIRPVDMPQASIGPGMAVFSRYKRVLEASGEPMSIRMALAHINRALDEYLSGQDGDLDPETRFAVRYFEQFGFSEGAFGDADNMARAKNTSVDSVVLAGVAEASGGKVRLKHWKEYDPGAWAPEQDERITVWEVVHHLIERLNTHGERGAAELLNRVPPAQLEQARQLLYLLYDIAERREWASEAFEYNKLASVWSDINDLARQSNQGNLV